MDFNGLTHLHHVIAQGLELYGDTHPVHLVECGDESPECLFRAWLYAEVHESVVKAGSTFRDDTAQLLHTIAVEEQDLLGDIVIKMVEIDAVTKVFV